MSDNKTNNENKIFKSGIEAWSGSFKHVSNEDVVTLPKPIDIIIPSIVEAGTEAFSGTFGTLDTDALPTPKKAGHDHKRKSVSPNLNARPRPNL